MVIDQKKEKKKEKEERKGKKEREENLRGTVRDRIKGEGNGK